MNSDDENYDGDTEIVADVDDVQDAFAIPRSYDWFEWLKDHEDELWFLYIALTSSSKQNGYVLFDQLNFGDFVSFARKQTHQPIRPKFDKKN